MVLDWVSLYPPTEEHQVPSRSSRPAIGSGPAFVGVDVWGDDPLRESLVNVCEADPLGQLAGRQGLQCRSRVKGRSLKVCRRTTGRCPYRARQADKQRLARAAVLRMIGCGAGCWPVSCGSARNES